MECPSDSPGTPCPSSRRVLWRWRGKLECFLERQLDWLKGNASLVFLKSASHGLGPEKMRKAQIEGSTTNTRQAQDGLGGKKKRQTSLLSLGSRIAQNSRIVSNWRSAIKQSNSVPSMLANASHYRILDGRGPESAKSSRCLGS